MVKFRAAQLADLETLNSVSLQSKAHWGYPESWMEHWVDELTLDAEKFHDQNILVVESENEVIGFASIKEYGDHYELLHLWVLPAYIGKGIGKKLLAEITDTHVKAEKPIKVEADPNAEAFYKSQGFVTYDKIESYPKGRFLPVMKKLAGK